MTKEEAVREFFIDAYCKCGHHVFSGYTIRVVLPEIEAQRLISVASNPKTYYGRFYRCEELKDIYDKIYKDAVEEMTDLYYSLSTTDKSCTIRSEDWRIDDTFECWVEFPKEIEKLIPWFKRKGKIRKIFKFIDWLYENEVLTVASYIISSAWLGILLNKIEYDSIWQGIFVVAWAIILMSIHFLEKIFGKD